MESNVEAERESSGVYARLPASKGVGIRERERERRVGGWGGGLERELGQPSCCSSILSSIWGKTTHSQSQEIKPEKNCA